MRLATCNTGGVEDMALARALPPAHGGNRRHLQMGAWGERKGRSVDGGVPRVKETQTRVSRYHPGLEAALGRAESRPTEK